MIVDAIEQACRISLLTMCVLMIQVERLYRDVRAYAIPGGSEEIMLDLSIRQALRVHKALGMKL